MSNVSLINLKISDTTTLQRLLQLYYFDSTSWSKEDIGIDALYDGSTASDLESYVNSQEAKAYLIWVNKVLVGFVLLDRVEVEERSIWELADLFILPKYRGGWIALEVVRQIFEQISTPILVATFKENELALRFFKAVSRRLQLNSVRELIEDETTPFYTFIINEHI